jgi:hypothetical protein
MSWVPSLYTIHSPHTIDILVDAGNMCGFIRFPEVSRHPHSPLLSECSGVWHDGQPERMKKLHHLPVRPTCNRGLPGFGNSLTMQPWRGIVRNNQSCKVALHHPHPYNLGRNKRLPWGWGESRALDRILNFGESEANNIFPFLHPASSSRSINLDFLHNLAFKIYWSRVPLHICT